MRGSRRSGGGGGGGGWRGAGLALALLGAACGGSPTQPTPPPPPLSPLALTCPADIAAESTDGNPVTVTPPPASASGGREPVTVVCATPEGNRFPLGETRVECRASDSALQQASCTYIVTVTRRPELRRTTFMAFGDSITAGVVSDPIAGALTAGGFPAFVLNLRPEASYPARLQERLRARYAWQASRIAVTNAGLPGERATEGFGRFEGLMRSLRPEAVLIMTGANDMVANVPRSQIIAAISEMAKEARFRGARVFLASHPPSLSGRQRSISQALILDLNHHIRITAAGEGAVFVDIYGALAADATRYVGVDGLHLTEAGYQRVADEFFEAIRREFEVG